MEGIISFQIPKDKVLRRLGYTSKTKLDKRTDDIINNEIEHASKLIKPSFVYGDLTVKSVTDDEIVFDRLSIKSKILSNKFNNVKKATIFIVSIGEELEKKTGKTLTDALRDAIGSEAVEEFAEHLNEQITHRAAAEGYKTLSRFSVGYGDWEIKHQKDIFRVLKPTFVSLGAGNIMHPQKSISAIVGWEKK